MKTVIHQLHEDLEKLAPGTWELRDSEDQVGYPEHDVYLTCPVGHREALEVEVSADLSELLLIFRSWDRTNGLDQEEHIMSVQVSYVRTAARTFAWYVSDGITFGEYGGVIL